MEASDQEAKGALSCCAERRAYRAGTSLPLDLIPGIREPEPGTNHARARMARIPECKVCTSRV